MKPHDEEDEEDEEVEMEVDGADAAGSDSEADSDGGGSEPGSDDASGSGDDDDDDGDDNNAAAGGEEGADDLDDEAMLRLDAQLGAAVRSMLSRGAGGAREQAAALMALQLRAAALLEEWLKRVRLLAGGACRHAALCVSYVRMFETCLHCVLTARLLMRACVFACQRAALPSPCAAC